MPDKRYTLKELKEISALIQKNDPASTTLPATNWHGPLQDGSGNYGLLATPGVRPQMFSTLTRPRSFMSLLAPEPSRYANELLEIMTGVLPADAGTNPTGWCGDPLAPGLAKTCLQSYQFGKFFGKTDLNAIPDIGLLRNRADMPRELLNQSPQMWPYMPDLMFRMVNTESRLQNDFWRFGVEFERKLARVAISGNSSLASTNTEWNWIKEFNGLERLIKTGHVDADSNTECPALDSIVIDWNSSALEDTVGSGDPRDISQVLVDTFFSIMTNAGNMGIDGLQLAVVMRPELFRALTYVLACDYTTFRCRTIGGQYNVADERRLQNDMYRRQYLWLDGEEVPVVFDHGIALDPVSAGSYKSSLFFVPISYSGGRLTRLEYFPMDNPYATEFANFAGNAPTVINNGMFAIAERDNGFCKEYLFAAQMRMILETPWLAARVDDITFTFRAETRAPYSDESFYANGGDTYVSA